MFWIVMGGLVLALTIFAIRYGLHTPDFLLGVTVGPLVKVLMDLLL